jgi:acetyltransferase-like isoleucine patch superfamily enzyme
MKNSPVMELPLLLLGKTKIDYLIVKLTTMSLMKFLNLCQRGFEGARSRYRNFYYQLMGVKIHGYVWMRSIEIPRNFSDIEIESNCALDRGVLLLCSGEPLPHPKIHIGASTYINRSTHLDATLSLRIGQHCGIGPGCYITDHDHGIDINLPPLEQPMTSKPTNIEDWVWIGANVSVLKGVTIGRGAVIGAGSVVTHNIPENAIAVGVPARVIKYKESLPLENFPALHSNIVQPHMEVR